MLVQGHVYLPLHSQISWRTLTNSTMLVILDFWKNSLQVSLLELKSKVFTVMPWKSIWHGVFIFEKRWEFLQHSCCTCSYLIFLRQQETYLEVLFSVYLLYFFLGKFGLWFHVFALVCPTACLFPLITFEQIYRYWWNVVMNTIQQEFLLLLCNLLHQ